MYAGHAEWAAGQLEGEIQNGDWHIVAEHGGARVRGSAQALGAARDARRRGRRRRTLAATALGVRYAYYAKLKPKEKAIYRRSDEIAKLTLAARRGVPGSDPLARASARSGAARTDRTRRAGARQRAAREPRSAAAADQGAVAPAEHEHERAARAVRAGRETHAGRRSRCGCGRRITGAWWRFGRSCGRCSTSSAITWTTSC